MTNARRNERLYLADILQAAREIADYTALDQTEFLGDNLNSSSSHWKSKTTS
jgi:uncharacterized protein with HEPN domain